MPAVVDPLVRTIAQRHAFSAVAISADGFAGTGATAPDVHTGRRQAFGSILAMDHRPYGALDSTAYYYHCAWGEGAVGSLSGSISTRMTTMYSWP